MNSLLASIAAACTAYSSWVAWQRENQCDTIEDEIDLLAADGSPASKLRLERLAQRLNRKRQSLGAL